MKSKRVVALVLCAVLWGTAIFAAPAWAEPIFVTIGTASVGGMFYPIGMTMAKLWNENIKDMKAVAIATAGSPQNLDMLRTGDIEVAVCRSLEGYRAIHGLGNYKEMPWVRSLTGGLFYDAKQVIALKGKGIDSIADFRGKRVAVGPVGSGGEVDARETLEVYGLTYKDITPEYIEAGQAVDMMKDGLIDGAILGITMGSSAVSELMMTGKVKILPMEDKEFLALKEKQKSIERRVIPAGIYPNQDYEVQTAGNPPDVIICREDLSEEQAYAMTKVLYENLEELRGVAVVMQQFGLNLVKPKEEMLIPYHPGSLRYFKEIGALK